MLDGSSTLSSSGRRRMYYRGTATNRYAQPYNIELAFFRGIGLFNTSATSMNLYFGEELNIEEEEIGDVSFTNESLNEFITCNINRPDDITTVLIGSYENIGESVKKIKYIGFKYGIGFSDSSGGNITPTKNYLVSYYEIPEVRIEPGKIYTFRLEFINGVLV